MRSTGKHWLSYFGEPALMHWEDDEYHVAGFIDQGTLRLDICRKDGRDGITWDQLQRIKAECGFGDRDAAEFYPADVDVINTGHHRHLYIFAAPIPLIRRTDP